MSEHSQKSRDKCAASCALGSAVVSYLVCSFAISTILLLFFCFFGLILVPAVIIYLLQLGAKYCLEMLEIFEETKPS